jgi:hypothetical protein
MPANPQRELAAILRRAQAAVHGKIADFAKFVAAEMKASEGFKPTDH